MSQTAKVLYTGKTHTTGGRDGAARSTDGRLDVKLSGPGSSAPGTNPEQMFAAAGPRASSARWDSPRKS